jgi:glycine dehydrogenase subunit 1
MLAVIGEESVDALFRDVPDGLYNPAGPEFPPALSEAELQRHMAAVAAQNTPLGAMPSFLGGGACRHYIPAVVDALASRGEFLTAYTPYQAEASQGTLQTIFEFQTMVGELAGLPLSNASLYDGATALVEAMFMVQGGPTGKKGADRTTVLVSAGVHPEYLETVRTYYESLPYEVEVLPLDDRGRTDLDALRDAASRAAVFAFQSPSFLGTIDDARAVCAAAREAGAEVVQVFCPIGGALLTSPGEAGASAAVAEGQPLGNPVNFGGPHLGLLAARQEYARKLPGRLVGWTRDVEGKPGYVLTLQTREQHIRRDRATSNICTNVGLVATRATIHMAALGKQGLRQVAEVCLERAHHAAERIAALPGFGLRFPKTPFFKEVAITCPLGVRELNARLFERGVIGGLDLGRFIPGEAQTMLLSFTELTTPGDIDALVRSLEEATS